MITLFSPAKLNLFFRVLERYKDGYHEIASLYQAVSLGDFLRIERAEQDGISCSYPRVPKDGSNLLFKALDLFRRKTRRDDLQIHFHLDKRIPLQSGLGGGSSNAASALFGLNQLAETKIPEEQLRQWAADIGSDVPFFFSTGTAYCTGRGERVENLAPLPVQKLWIAKPEMGLSTKKVYEEMVKLRGCKAQPKTDFSGCLCIYGQNDLEIPAFTLLPELARIKEDLFAMGFTKVCLTGSGTAFFCLGDNSPSPLKGVQFFEVEFIYRNAESWYVCKN